MDLLSPDDIDYFLSQPFIQAFWPGIIGFFVLFFFASKGPRWMMFPVLMVSGFYQALHIGMI